MTVRGKASDKQNGMWSKVLFFFSIDFFFFFCLSTERQTMAVELIVWQCWSEFLSICKNFLWLCLAFFFLSEWPLKKLFFLFLAFFLPTAPEYCWRPWTSRRTADLLPAGFYLVVSENWIPLCALFSLPLSIKSVNHCCGPVLPAAADRNVEYIHPHGHHSAWGRCSYMYWLFPSLSVSPLFFFLSPLMSTLMEPKWQRNDWNYNHSPPILQNHLRWNRKKSSLPLNCDKWVPFLCWSRGSDYNNHSDNNTKTLLKLLDVLR